MVTRRIDQNGPKTLLTSPVSSLEAWTHDGRFLIYGLSSQSIWALPLGGDQKPIPIVEASSLVDEPRVSHDGRWLAYSASDTGRWEVYLQPFIRTGGRARVSTHGGGEPRWRADGKELFYMALDGAMMSADMTDQAKPGPARKLFDLRFWVNPVGDQNGRRSAVSGDCSRGPAGHTLDRAYQLAVRLGRTVAAVSTRDKRHTLFRTRPLVPPLSCARPPCSDVSWRLAVELIWASPVCNLVAPSTTI